MESTSKPFKTSETIYNSMTPFSLRTLESRHGIDYIDKMMHLVPPAPVVQDRAAFIIERCKSKRVLNLGCASGKLHEKIRVVASNLVGIDHKDPCDVKMDLDALPYPNTEIYPTTDLIVAGEVIEHLANPGNCLRWLRGYNSPLLITVPNAFSTNQWLKHGYEQVNLDHVCWYSYHTLKTLIERYGFKLNEFMWYRGQPLTAEGIIFIVS